MLQAMEANDVVDLAQQDGWVDAQFDAWNAEYSLDKEIQRVYNNAYQDAYNAKSYV